MTRLKVVLGCLSLIAAVARADDYTPAPAAEVPGYFPAVMPCKVENTGRSEVKCKDQILESKTLRELSIMRNTIYARWGWDGYRKPWLHDYFHAKPWFKPNPKFSYKLLSDADRKNAHLIATREQSLTTDDLEWMKQDVYARHGKVWNDVPEFILKSGKHIKTCKDADDAEYAEGQSNIMFSKDCHYKTVKWYKPDKTWKDDQLAPDDKVELGLIARSMGTFALDDEAREKAGDALDKQLPIAELRKLSLRDLRLLRNTIYARRGRTFKSEILREHFQGMTWYKVDPAYSDKVLTKVDQRNIGLIKSVENEFGGPLSDEDWLTEPATDGA